MQTLMDKAIQSGDEMRARLTEKAFTDADFRQKLVSDPKGTIAAEFGVEVPDNINVEVHECDMNTLHLALPPKAELDEEQLEMVAAGLSCCC